MGSPLHMGPEAAAAHELFARALTVETLDDLHSLWQEANKLVGKRSPMGDGGPFFVFGFLQGRMHASEQEAH